MQFPPIRETAQGISEQALASRPPIRAQIPQPCKDCRVDNAFHAWKAQELTPSFNWNIDFANWGIISPGKRAVIELVTATISVPGGEWARLRMSTSIGFSASNLDLVLTPQGQVGGQQIFVATHFVRVYSDQLIPFSVNRDNDQTEGHAFICISGYLIDI